MNHINLPIPSGFVRSTSVCMAVVVLLCLCSDVSACPTCKDGLAENDPAAQAMAAGYFYSILFMMAMPFLIIGTFGGFAYLSVRKAREADALATQASLNSRETVE